MKRIIFVLIGLLTAISGFSQASLQPAATINLIRTEVITVGQLRAEVERFESSQQQVQLFRMQLAQEMGRTPTDAELNRRLRLHILDVIINERLALQAAERDRIMISDNEINQQMQQLRGVLAQQLGRPPTDAEFERAIREESGLSVAEFRDQMRRQMVVQRYLLHTKGDLINSARPPTDEEIQREFNLRRGDFVRPETVEFVAIQIPFGNNAASRTAARTRADQLIREIGSNMAVFDRLVEESVLPNSGFNAGPGSLPRIPEAQAQFGQDFINVAFTLQQGQVSRLIETPNAYMIIKVTRNLEFRVLEIDDLVPPHILMQAGVDPRINVSVRNFLGQLLGLQRQQTVLAQASQELVTELRTGRTFQIFENNINW
ncbi:MAG: SurA N-terminal domain-containing protein [Treponema sp.]|nr:SurA N-terminal domain-containing protein [Treponema sp.]